MQPYKECDNCVATPFCKKFSGDTPSYGRQCDSNFLLDRALKLSRIPKIYLKANLYNYLLDKDNKDVHEKLNTLVPNIVNEVFEGTNYLFISAQTGTGKTFTASVILNHFIYKTCLTSHFDMENPLALFVSYPDLVNKLRYQRDDEEVFLLTEKIKEVPLLLLDDIGAGTLSDFVREQTYLILNERFNNGKSTIVTSNMTINELNQDTCLGKRNVSRILSNMKGIELKGNDRRWR